MEFPQKLNTLIERSGKSQGDLAEEVGVTQSAISAMTRGKRRPYMDQAFLLARALGVSLDFLADDNLDEPIMSEQIDKDRLVIETVRTLGHKEAMRRLLMVPESSPLRLEDDKSPSDGYAGESGYPKPAQPKRKRRGTG